MLIYARCNISTARSRDLQEIVALRGPTSSCDNQSLLFGLGSVLFDTQLYAMSSDLDSIYINLTRHSLATPNLDD